MADRVQPPTEGQKIVQEMFEEGKQKDLTEQQRTRQIQQQTQTQENLRRASKQGRARGSEEGREGEARTRKGGRTARGRRGPVDNRTKAEQAMDNFRERSLQIQRTRQAMTRQPSLSGKSAHGWSVMNSSQTTSQARQAIIARQASSQQASQSRPGTQASSQTLTSQTAQTGKMGQLMLRYARPQQSRGERSARPFQQRFQARQQLSRQLGQLLVQQQATTARGAGAQQAAVLVHVRGNLVFVRDGQKTRAFRLNRDGSLSELSSEDASEQPLSPKARAQLRKVLRHRGVRARAHRGRSDHAEKLKGEIRAAEQRGQEATKGEMDLETKFAILLHEVLEKERLIGRKLGEGEDPEFPEKEDWEGFFARMAKLGNQEKASKKTLDKIMSLLFRGLFQKKGKGKYLVGDLKYLAEGKNRTEKFAQIPVDQKGLLKLLAGLKPGQKITKETLKNFFAAEELLFLKMAHQSQKSYNMAEGAERNVLFNPRAGVDPYSQARLEHSLLSSRKQGQKETPKDLSREGSLYERPQGVFANVYELMGLRERFEGKPRSYTLVAYLILTGAVGLSLFFLLSRFL